MMDSNGNMTAGGWIFWILAGIIILGLVAAAVAWTTRERSRRRGREATSARELLDRRLATGEIDSEQYANVRRSLASQPDSGADAPAVRSADARV